MQVEFSPGNLDESGRGFVAHQWEKGGYFGWGTGKDPSNKSENWLDYPKFNDWGDSIEGSWRTLSYYECGYLLHYRPEAEEKVALGTVNDVRGLILLPDNWNLPKGCTFVAGKNGWNGNVYTVEQWQVMERAGAVFLPAAGGRNDAGVFGGYWLSTPSDGIRAWELYFDEDHVFREWIKRIDAHSVRLVRNSGIRNGI